MCVRVRALGGADLSLDLGVRLDSAGRAQHHPPPHLLPLHTPHQGTNLIARLSHLHLLVKHLNTLRGRGEGGGGERREEVRAHHSSFQLNIVQCGNKSM